MYWGMRSSWVVVSSSTTHHPGRFRHPRSARNDTAPAQQRLLLALEVVERLGRRARPRAQHGANSADKTSDEAFGSRHDSVFFPQITRITSRQVRTRSSPPGAGG